MKTTALALVILSILLFVERSGADDASTPHKVRLSRFTELSAPPLHLKPVEGRAFYRGPRSLQHRYPYICVANRADRKERSAYELRPQNVHQLLEPIESAEAALELAQIFSGGTVIEDAERFTEILDAARREQERLEHWDAEIRAGLPSRYGMSAKATADGWRVRRLVLSCAGHGSIDVLEEEWHIRTEGPTTHENVAWLAGPPQSWQTASFGLDEEGEKKAEREQRAMRLEVTRFREAVVAPLGRRRSAKEVESAGAALTFAAVRRQLGEPDFELQNRVYSSERSPAEYVYRVADGSAYVFTARGEDAKLAGVRLVSGVTLQEDGTYRLGSLVRRL